MLGAPDFSQVMLLVTFFGLFTACSLVFRLIGRDALHRFYKEEGEAALKPCKRLLDRAGIAYEAEIDVGHVAETIVNRARKADWRASSSTMATCRCIFIPC